MSPEDKIHVQILKSAIHAKGLSIKKSEQHVEGLLAVVSAERNTIRMEKKQLYKAETELSKFLKEKK